MISETVLLWLGTFGLLVDYAGVARAQDRLSAAIAHVFALLFWLAFTISALNYTVYSGGTALTASSQSLALIGLVAVVVTIVLLVSVAFDSVGSAVRTQE